MMSFSKLMPLVAQFGQYLKLAIDHYSDLRAAGEEVDPSIIAIFLQMQMKDWNPVVSGKELLDDETRNAAARFLAGVAVNFARA